MDWERKFTTIVHETEANLDRVRRRLQAAKSNVEVTLPIIPVSPVVPNLKKKSIVREKYSADKTSHKMSEHEPTSPPIWATVLEEKFSKQQKIIDSLTATVISLQNEKQRQTTTIEQLKDSVAGLEERVREKGVDLDTESKISQWKLETRHEISELKQQVYHQQKSDQHTLLPTPSQSALEHLRALVTDTKNFCRDEVDGTKRDIDYYKNRIARLEKTQTALNIDVSELSRKHEDLSTGVTGFTERYKADYRELSIGIREKETGISITRSELAALKADIADTVTAPKQLNSRSPSYHPQRQMAVSSDEKPLSNHPIQWRELLSHSLSTMSVDSSDSTLSSGYLARKRSQDSTLEEPATMPLRHPRHLSPTLLYYQTDKPALFVILVWLSYILALALLINYAVYPYLF